MQTLYNLASNLKQTICADMSIETIKDQITAINDRTEHILDALQFNPDNVPTVNLFKKSEDERKSQIDSLSSLCDKHEVLYLPFLYQSGRDYISKRFRSDLTLFATDFIGRRNLQFTVATSSFGTPSTTTMTPETEKDRVNSILQRMTDDGYIIQNTNYGKALTDCDTNHDLLRSYCASELHGTVIEFRSRKNTIRSFRVLVSLEDIPSFVYEEPIKQTANGTLTKDTVTALKKELGNLMDCLSSYGMMKSRCSDLILSNCQHIVYTIEDITGVHGSVYKQLESVHQPIRAMNQTIRRTQNQVQVKAAEKIKDRAVKLYDTVSDACEQFAATFGMYPHKVTFLPYQQLSIELIQDQIGLNKDRIRPERQAILTPSDEILAGIETDIQKELPSATITNYSARKNRDNSGKPFATDTVTIILDDMRDLLPLLQIYTPKKEGHSNAD